MSDRPTYTDYLFHREGSYILSRGEYFTVINHKRRFLYWAIGFGVLLAAIGILMWLEITDRIWPVWMHDVHLAAIPLFFLVTWLQYRRAHFINVKEGTEDWEKASKQVFSAIAQIIWIVMLLFNFLLFAPNGFTVSYIRSQLDGGGQVRSARITIADGEELFDDVYLAEKTMMISIPKKKSAVVEVNVTVIRTPASLIVSLDGQPLPPGEWTYRTSHFYASWSEYFKQYGYYTIPTSDIRDGSVLTLTCGDLYREWVFEVADKEAS